MGHRELHCKGILPPLTTPFDVQGRVYFEGLRRNVKRYNEAGLAGYVALGSNGEAVHLDVEEQQRVISTIREWALDNHTIITGVNEHSTYAAMAATRRAAEAGADAALVITPYFYKSRMTQTAQRGSRQMQTRLPSGCFPVGTPSTGSLSGTPASWAAMSGDSIATQSSGISASLVGEALGCGVGSS